MYIWVCLYVCLCTVLFAYNYDSAVVTNVSFSKCQFSKFTTHAKHSNSFMFIEKFNLIFLVTFEIVFFLFWKRRLMMWLAKMFGQTRLATNKILGEAILGKCNRISGKKCKKNSLSMILRMDRIWSCLQNDKEFGLFRSHWDRETSLLYITHEILKMKIICIRNGEFKQRFFQLRCLFKTNLGAKMSKNSGECWTVNTS